LDLQIEVPALTSSDILSAPPGESSAVVRERVLAARARQRQRGTLNAMLPNAALKSAWSLDGSASRLIVDAVDRGGMSARGVHRALRVARTIADLAGVQSITSTNLAEALQYRAYETRRTPG
jgi:magnesium chelatase family protein